MSTVRVLMSTTNLPLSWVIRVTTWSEYSHCAIVDGDHVIEAAAGHGVVSTPLADALHRAKKYCFIDIEVADDTAAKAIIDAAKSQIGKPYDWIGILGLSLKRDWQQADSWFCSELVAWAFAQGGKELFWADVMRRVNPQHINMLPYPRYQT